MKTTLIAACLVACTGAAQAATITFGPGSNTHSSYPYLDFDNLVTPTSISGDAVLSFAIEEGDVNSSSEYLDVFIDGFSLGRVFDDDPSNDIFDVPGDSGPSSNLNVSASAVIPGAVFAGLISDGFLSLRFEKPLTVSRIYKLSGSITFSSAIAPVPLSATAGMLGLGLLGLGMMWRRKGGKPA